VAELGVRGTVVLLLAAFLTDKCCAAWAIPSAASIFQINIKKKKVKKEKKEKRRERNADASAGTRRAGQRQGTQPTQQTQST
jgi:hypothetical protein